MGKLQQVVKIDRQVLAEGAIYIVLFGGYWVGLYEIINLQLLLQIITISLVILVPAMLHDMKPGNLTVISCVIYTLSYFMANLWQLSFVYLQPPQAYGFALRLYTLSALAMMVVYAGIVLIGLSRAKPIVFDLQTRLVWLVLLISEGWAVVEYMECKLFVDPFGSGDFLLSQIWGIEVSRFACGRRFGPVAPYIAPVVTSLYLIWINWRAGGIKR